MIHFKSSTSKLQHVSKTCRILFFRQYSKAKAKPLTTEFALNHFDQFYGSIFKNWPSIRLGLLCPHSYCAVLNVFANIKETADSLQDPDIYNLRDVYNKNLFKLETQKQSDPTEKNFSSQTTENVNSRASENIDVQQSENEPNNFSEESFEMQKDDASQEISENDYMPVTKLKHRDESNEDYSEFYDRNINYEAALVRGDTILYPEHWEIYLCNRGKFKKFPPPSTDATSLLNYYLMDGASILPVLALDIRKGEEVGDLCASPGGKTLAIIFGLQFGKLVCNDASLSRLGKLKTVLHSYLPGTEDWSKRIRVSNIDVSDWECFEAFDKILLDVPCTNDRLSVMKNENNIFSQKRFYERMQLPKEQTNMLRCALKALKPGGSLVYSTCSLSPIQNDGVVHIALSKLSVECPMEFSVVDLKDAFSPLRNMYQFSDVCKFGQLVVPFLPLNYGPLYISKITRNK